MNGVIHRTVDRTRLYLLAAVLCCCCLPALALRPDTLETRVGGWDPLPSGQASAAGPQTLATAMGYGGGGYETASGQWRWLNRDPIGERGGVNLYQAMGNNAVNRIDPFGLLNADRYEEVAALLWSQYNGGGINEINYMFPAGPDGTPIPIGIPDFNAPGLQSADGDFLLLSGLADGLAAAGKFGLGLAEAGIKAAGKCFAKEAPQAAKPAWSKPLTQAQSQKLADAMAKSLDDKLKTGGFNAAMYEIMIENGATPAEAYAATFGRLKP